MASVRALVLFSIQLTCFFLVPQVNGSDKNKPHKHQGVLEPYSSEKPRMNLKEKQLQDLLAGKTVLQQLVQGGGGRAIVIQDVHAPSDIVWDRILDFSGYPKMVPKLAQCECYSVEKEDCCCKIRTRMEMRAFGVKLEYFVNNYYFPKQSACTWTLDYSNSSDLDESVGCWYVEPHPDPRKTDWSRVYFSLALVPPSWIPRIAKAFLMTKDALSQSTAWVKVHSEKQYTQMQKDGCTTFCSVSQYR